MDGDNLNVTAIRGRLEGAVDNFVAPRLLTGWVRNSERVGSGQDITVSVYRGNVLIAKGPPTRSRADIVSSSDYFSEFRLECSEDLPDEIIAFDLLRIIASDQEGRTARLFVWDRVRGRALSRLLEYCPALGKEAVGALLYNIGLNKNLTEEVRTAVRKVHDSHFEEKITQLLYQFESLGNDCSLGGLQRAFGAEPLGLFRFAGIEIDDVVRALRGRCIGVGSPEFTRLILSDGGEYISTDTRYGMSSHTFVCEGDVALDRFYEQQCKKIAFLARNILEKLEEGEKIFLVHAMPNFISDEKLQELLVLMRELGSGLLLYLHAPSEDLPVGQFRSRRDGIMEGSVRSVRGDDDSPESRESWLQVLLHASAHVREVVMGE
jgi:hypothetical protein